MPRLQGTVTIDEWAEGVTYTVISNGKPDPDKELRSYKGDDGGNLYFNITSDQTGGGSGYATIDSGTGTITLKEGFTASHYIKVQIYQKVSGIDGSYGGNDINQMQLLKEIYVYPTNATKISEGGEITLSEYLPVGTYYENQKHEVTVPAYAQAELVVKYDGEEINRILLQNDTAASTEETFTTADLIAYRNIENFQVEKLKFSLENPQVTSGGIESFSMQRGTTSSDGVFTELENDPNIEFGKFYSLTPNLETRIYLYTREECEYIQVKIGDVLLDTVVVDDYEASQEDETAEGIILYYIEYGKTVGELLEGSGLEYDNLPDTTITFFHYNSEDQPLEGVTGKNNIHVSGAAGITYSYRWQLRFKDEVNATTYILTESESGIKGRLQYKDEYARGVFTQSDLRLDDNGSETGETSVLWDTNRFKFTGIERSFDGFKFDATDYSDEVTLSLDPAVTTWTVNFGNQQFASKIYLLLGSSGLLQVRKLVFENAGYTPPEA